MQLAAKEAVIVAALAVAAACAVQRPLEVAVLAVLAMAAAIAGGGAVALQHLQHVVQGMRALEHAVQSLDCAVQRIGGHTGSMKAGVDHLKVTLCHVETRLEGFTMEGSEAVRHLCQIMQEFSLELSGNSARYAHRRAMEYYVQWATARRRLKELCSDAAWSLIAEQARREMLAAISEKEYEVQTLQRWLEHPAQQGLSMQMRDKYTMELWDMQQTGQRWSQNVEWLPRNVWFFRGAPAVGNILQEMARLEREHEGQSPGAASSMERVNPYSTGVHFMSKQLVVEGEEGQEEQ